MTKMKAELEEIQLQMALLKAETTEKISDLRNEQIQRAANLKGEAAVKLTTFKAETAMRTEERIKGVKGRGGTPPVSYGKQREAVQAFGLLPQRTAAGQPYRLLETVR